MGLLLSEQLEYYRENINDTSSAWDWVTGKFKRVGALMVNFSAVLLFLFFLVLTALVNFLGN